VNGRQLADETGVAIRGSGPVHHRVRTQRDLHDAASAGVVRSEALVPVSYRKSRKCFRCRSERAVLVVEDDEQIRG
jgi:hypothetical protein